MKKLAVLVCTALGVGIAVLSGCSSSTTPGASDSGAVDAGVVDSTTPVSDSSFGPPTGTCDDLAKKTCPKDPEPPADAKSICETELKGSCASTFAALLSCTKRNTTCNASGESETKSCDTEAGAYVACKTPPAVDAGTDSATATDSGVVPAVNRCTTYVDARANAATRNLDWDFPIASAANRCITISVGQTVTFTGDFNVHPISASGGTTPSPIVNGGAADPSVTITFPSAGTFGYICDMHANMLGAIRVVP